MGVGEGDGDGEGDGEGDACGVGSPICAEEGLTDSSTETNVTNDKQTKKIRTISVGHFVFFVFFCGLISSSKRRVLVSALR